MESAWSHRPVLLFEVLNSLSVRADGWYIDGTFGQGGHTAALLERLGPKGRVWALDRDPAAEAVARARFGNDPRLVFVRRPFSRLAETVAEYGVLGRIQGIVLDLGVSSPQLDDPRRGFSFARDGPLDMRMDPTTGLSAAEWLARVTEQELAQTLAKGGEERFARRIARAVVTARQHNPLRTTRQLADLIAAVVPTREPGKNPATRTFQAIRIAVNEELSELQAVLPQTLVALAPGGRLGVISFHSLEDRLVKQFIREQVQGRDWPLDLPVPGRPGGRTLRRIGRRAIRPSAAEIAANPRARSAVLRVAERLA